MSLAIFMIIWLSIGIAWKLLKARCPECGDTEDTIPFFGDYCTECILSGYYGNLFSEYNKLGDWIIDEERR